MKDHGAGLAMHQADETSAAPHGFRLKILPE
jgi:hypothetical protein